MSELKTIRRYGSAAKNVQVLSHELVCVGDLLRRENVDERVFEGNSNCN